MTKTLQDKIDAMHNAYDWIYRSDINKAIQELRENITNEIRLAKEANPSLNDEGISGMIDAYLLVLSLIGEKK